MNAHSPIKTTGLAGPLAAKRIIVHSETSLPDRPGPVVSFQIVERRKGEKLTGVHALLRDALATGATEGVGGGTEAALREYGKTRRGSV